MVKRILRGAFFISGLVCLSSLTGCVQSKKLAYLQYKQDIKGDNVTDSLLRRYALKKKVYTLQPGDIISIRVGSLTEEEYDFISKYQTDLGIIRKLSQYNQTITPNSGNDNLGNRGNIGLNAGQQGGISNLLISNQNIGFTLDQAGELELPEIGKFNLSGLTIPEAELRIRELLLGYYETPIVRIELLNYHFTVLGEVESEGRYTSFDPEITIFDAIALAGNIGEFADRSNVKIIRQVDGEANVLYLDMLDERTLDANNFYVNRNDIIVVPALDARAGQTYAIPNISVVLGWVGAILGVVGFAVAISR
jgi:polysaccharide export outer membrane protein